ncbi:hypothetical protein PAXINDRAFT_170598 [Paxillus involutus ATCC 200175]|uniref:Uncharacterized protein n=1 Tax=Paxillus involutus ATCC 200175 TaxID=664439 RepID=A0A0C9TSM3_PAXIN|nr:hypothetical protein PAXINDRAFT_170598 [Paxillus involutus ATCC 200175]
MSRTSKTWITVPVIGHTGKRARPATQGGNQPRVPELENLELHAEGGQKDSTP